MRKTLFKWHSAMALVAILPLAVMSITGSILVFKFEIDSLLMPEKATLNYQHSRPVRRDMVELINTVVNSHPDYEIGSWEIFDDGSTADRVYLIRHDTDTWFKTYLDPYQGVMLSKPVGIHSDLTDFLLHLHYTLLLDDISDTYPNLGMLIGLLVAILFTLLGITGLIIYRRFWVRFFSFRWGGPAIIILGDLHKLVGIWSSPVLLILGITGIYFNAVEYYHEAFEHHEESAHVVRGPLFNRQLDFDSMLAASKQAINGFHPTYWLFPFDNEQTQITIYGSVDDINPFISNYAATVSFDAQSGESTFNYDIRQASIPDRIIDSFRKLHFGHFAGLPSKIIWCVMGSAPVLLGLTGIWLWWQRKRKKQVSRANREVQAATS